MWILIKLSIALCGFIVRLIAKYIGPQHLSSDRRLIDGVDLYLHLKKSKHGNVFGTTYAIGFKSRSVFKLSPETEVDRLFKKWGFSTEIQTGDRDFDQHVYIASDSSAFSDEIKRDVKTRELIRALFVQGCESISGDGKTLRFKFSGDYSNESYSQAAAAQLSLQLADLDKSWRGTFHDPFSLRILLCEAVIWSVACYAASSFAGWLFFDEDVHISTMPLIRQGLLLGMVAAVTLLVFVVFFLRGSSRGHRIVVEGMIVLCLSLPVGGIGMIGDVNTELDRSEGQVYVAKVTDLYSKIHRRRRSTYHTYHVHISPLREPQEYSLPRHIKISSSTYSYLRKGGFVNISVGDGRLHHPWIRSITPSLAY